MGFGAKSQVGEQDVAAFGEKSFGEGEVDSCSIDQQVAVSRKRGPCTGASACDDGSLACKRKCHMLWTFGCSTDYENGGQRPKRVRPWLLSHCQKRNGFPRGSDTDEEGIESKRGRRISVGPLAKSARGRKVCRSKGMSKAILCAFFHDCSNSSAKSLEDTNAREMISVMNGSCHILFLVGKHAKYSLASK